jgi:hypothetical protein
LGVAVYQGDLIMGVHDHRDRVRCHLGAIDKDTQRLTVTGPKDKD